MWYKTNFITYTMCSVLHCYRYTTEIQTNTFNYICRSLTKIQIVWGLFWKIHFLNIFEIIYKFAYTVLHKYKAPGSYHNFSHPQISKSDRRAHWRKTGTAPIHWLLNRCFIIEISVVKEASEKEHCHWQQACQAKCTAGEMPTCS